MLQRFDVYWIDARMGEDPRDCCFVQDEWSAGYFHSSSLLTQDHWKPVITQKMAATRDL